MDAVAVALVGWVGSSVVLAFAGAPVLARLSREGDRKEARRVFDRAA